MRQKDVRHKYGAEGHVRPQCYCTAFENINKSVKADSLVPCYLLEFFAFNMRHKNDKITVKMPN